VRWRYARVNLDTESRRFVNATLNLFSDLRMSLSATNYLSLSRSRNDLRRRGAKMPPTSKVLPDPFSAVHGRQADPSRRSGCSMQRRVLIADF
jgi:hypothetical protein